MRLTNPRSSSSRSNWNLEMLISKEGGKPENPEKNPGSKDENQQQTLPTHDAIGGRRELSPLRHPCSPRSILNPTFSFWIGSVWGHLPVKTCSQSTRNNQYTAAIPYAPSPHTQLLSTSTTSPLRHVTVMCDMARCFRSTLC